MSNSGNGPLTSADGGPRHFTGLPIWRHVEMIGNRTTRNGALQSPRSLSLKFFGQLPLRTDKERANILFCQRHFNFGYAFVERRPEPTHKRLVQMVGDIQTFVPLSGIREDSFRTIGLDGLRETTIMGVIVSAHCPGRLAATQCVHSERNQDERGNNRGVAFWQTQSCDNKCLNV